MILEKLLMKLKFSCIIKIRVKEPEIISGSFAVIFGEKGKNKIMMDKNRDVFGKIKLFVLDMDGTIYLGDQPIEGAMEFLEKVKATGRDFMFFTNNSSKTGEMYVDKLAKMGCHVTEKDIMTSGDVTIAYLKTHYPDKSIFLAGVPELEDDFKKAGLHLTDDQADIVVVAFDKTLTYAKLEKICHQIRHGSMFLATHLDINCPMENQEFIPDCGAMCAAISLSTGKKPKYLGKPFKETVDMICRLKGCRIDEIAFVGDRLYTDVATGVNNGSTGILVLSGETRPEDLATSDIQPDLVFDSLKEMGAYL